MKLRSYRARSLRGLIVASFFLYAQVIAVAHAATYGDPHHTHGGAPCLIQLISDGPGAPGTTGAVPIVEVQVAHNTGATLSYLSTFHFDHSRPTRAPPAPSR